MKRSESQKRDPARDQDGLNRLLLLLDSDRDRAGVRYVELRGRLRFYFGARGCSMGDELVDESISRVIGKVAEGEAISNIEGYLFGVGRYVLKEYWAAQGKEIPEIGDLPPSQEPYVDPAATERDREADRLAERRHECMRRCLASLPADERQLVTDYCVKAERQQTASRLGTSLKNLRVKVHRIRAKLRECLRAFLDEPSASEI